MSRLTRETPELANAIRRLMRALERRAAAGDDEAAVQIVRLAGEGSAMANTALAAAHAYGYSYADLAAWLGTTRQSVMERVQRGQHGSS